MIPEILFLVEQISPTTTQIYNLRASIAIFFQTRALEAVEGVRNTLTTTHNTLVLVIAEGALVANTGQRCRTHVGVADGTLPVALVT